MTTIADVRNRSIRRSAGYWLWLLVACTFVAAAWIAGLRIPGSGVFLLATVPFAVVAAHALEQSRVNRALVAEIDELRALVSAWTDRAPN